MFYLYVTVLVILIFELNVILYFYSFYCMFMFHVGTITVSNKDMDTVECQKYVPMVKPSK